MKEKNDLLKGLTKQVDDAIESLLMRLKIQETKISRLKEENKHLRDNYIQLVGEIKQYIIELEQIKSHYVDSNYNSKQ